MVSVYLINRLKFYRLKIASVYFPPSQTSLNNQLSIIDCLKFYPNCVINGASNAKSPLWSSNATTDAKGKELEDFISSISSIALNGVDSSTYDISYSSPDATLRSIRLIRYLENWHTVEDYPSLSDHSYITFKLSFSPSEYVPIADSMFNFNKTNWSTFSAILFDKKKDKDPPEPLLAHRVSNRRFICRVFFRDK